MKKTIEIIKKQIKLLADCGENNKIPLEKTEIALAINTLAQTLILIEEKGLHKSQAS